MPESDKTQGHIKLALANGSKGYIIWLYKVTNIKKTKQKINSLCFKAMYVEKNRKL